VILKAAAGGGGRGMRIVAAESEMEGQLATAGEEAQKAFGDGRIYLEKYLVEPRHIEFQVFGDLHGKVIHLGERECSIQRRHQKLIVHDRTRPEAIARMSRALDFFVVEGIHTSIPLHKRILRDPELIAGRLSTRFLEGFVKRQAQAG